MPGIDYSAGLNLKSPAYQPGGVLRDPLDMSAYPLEDTARMEEILIEELDFLSGRSLRATIRQHHHMDGGARVEVGTKWSRFTLDAKIPMTGVLGHVSEAGLRHIVRSMVFGRADDLRHRQPQGWWCLETYKIRKVLDGKEGARRVPVMPQGANQRVVLDFGKDGSGDLTLAGYGAGKSISPKEGGVQAPRRTVFMFDLTYVDVTGSDMAIWKHGRLDDGTWSLQAQQSANLDQLSTTIEKFVQASMANMAATQQQQDASPELPPEVQALLAAAEKMNLTPAQLLEAVTANVSNAAEAQQAPPPGLPEGFNIMHGKVSWTCPECSQGINAMPANVGSHLAAHVRAGDFDEERKTELFTLFTTALQALQG
ncbi:MAG: hypothetical protein ABIL09_12970 [Gemmatimonadota bacterium]